MRIRSTTTAFDQVHCLRLLILHLAQVVGSLDHSALDNWRVRWRVTARLDPARLHELLLRRRRDPGQISTVLIRGVLH